KLNRLLDDIDVAVELEQLERITADDRAVRDVFSKLEFRSLLKRVLDQVGSGTGESAEPEVEMPTVEQYDAAGIASWLSAARGTVGVTVEMAEGKPTRVGFADTDRAAEVDWSDGVPGA